VCCGAPPHNSSYSENCYFYSREDDLAKLAEWDRNFNDLMDERIEAGKREPKLKGRSNIWDFGLYLSMFGLLIMVGWATVLWIFEAL